MSHQFFIAVARVLTVLAACATTAQAGQNAGRQPVRAVPELIGAWQASIEGNWQISYQVDLVLNGDGIYEIRMARLNGREPVWMAGSRGHYTVERPLPARYEYAKAWVLRLDPAETTDSPAAAAQVMRVYGLPVDRPVSLSIQFSPANLGGNFGGPTLTVDGEPGSTGFGMRRVASTPRR
jgi:hypothetical protein